MRKLLYVFIVSTCFSCNFKETEVIKNIPGNLTVPEKEYTTWEHNFQSDASQHSSSSATDHIYGKNVTIKIKIVGIRDGDSVDGVYGDLPVGIRLAHIDSPEKKQAFGKAAKQKLSDLCFGKTVTIVSQGKKGTYHGGRIIAEIFLEDGSNVNKLMVSEGFAWHYKKYSKDMSYDELENVARNNKRGLWKEQNPVSPWDFR